MKKNHFPAGALVKLLGATVGEAGRLLSQKSTLRQWPRLLREGVDPVVHFFLQANNTALIHLWLSRGTKVVFVSSFPRSGNTWMRFLLSDILLQMHGLKTTTRLPVHPDNLMPEFGTNCISRRITRCPPLDVMGPPAAFVKTHFLFERHQPTFLRRSGEARPSAHCKILYLYRAPEDALVSFYHMSQRQPWARAKTAHGIESFCRTETPNWVKNISSYLKAADEGYPVFFLSYEKLLESPALVLGHLLCWMSIPHDDTMVQRAVSNMHFPKLQAMEMEESQAHHNASERNLFFRRGCTGSGRAELNESLLQDIHCQTDALLTEANRREATQFSSPMVSEEPVWKERSTGSEFAGSQQQT